MDSPRGEIIVGVAKSRVSRDTVSDEDRTRRALDFLAVRKFVDWLTTQPPDMQYRLRPEEIVARYMSEQKTIEDAFTFQLGYDPETRAVRFDAVVSDKLGIDMGTLAGLGQAIVERGNQLGLLVQLIDISEPGNEKRREGG